MIDVLGAEDAGHMYTAFAPAERAPASDVRRQHEKLSALPFVGEFLDAMPNMAVVLNAERQIVLSNEAFDGYISQASPVVGAQRREAFHRVVSSAIGRRPGEAVGCVHSNITRGGCGTSPFCRNCGAANAIVNSQQWQRADVQECRLICGEAGVREMALDFRIWAQPIDVEGETYTVFALTDISHEKRREALERIFFHDVMNTAGGVKGLADLMTQTSLPEAAMRDAAGMIADSANQLIEEIGAQRALSAAESGDLKVMPQEAHSLDMIDRVVRHFHSYCASRGKEVRMDDATDPLGFTTDPVLLRRVLVNLVKNALEAVPAGAVVTIGAHAENDDIVFTVHNPGAMPNEVQQQVFQRSFSTKGSGRGLGTYSIKLLTERYLHGRASFFSDVDDGTTFVVRYPMDLITQLAER